MSDLRLEIANEQTRFTPGDRIEGNVAWSLDERPEQVQLCLFWHTAGKGDRDVGIAVTMPFDDPSPRDERPFSLKAPPAPYSFSGQLITLTWSLELIVNAGDEVERRDLVISPTTEELALAEPDASSATR
jgi:hypothetical protein